MSLFVESRFSGVRGSNWIPSSQVLFPGRLFTRRFVLGSFSPNFFMILLRSVSTIFICLQISESTIFICLLMAMLVHVYSITFIMCWILTVKLFMTGSIWSSFQLSLIFCPNLPGSFKNNFSPKDLSILYKFVSSRW